MENWQASCRFILASLLQRTALIASAFGLASAAFSYAHENNQQNNHVNFISHKPMEKTMLPTNL